MTQNEIDHFLDPICRRLSLTDQPSERSYIISRPWLNTSDKCVLLYFLEYDQKHRLVDISKGTGLSTVSVRRSLQKLIELEAIVNLKLDYYAPELGSANQLREYEIKNIEK